jgi:hypothetical protein
MNNDIFLTISSFFPLSGLARIYFEWSWGIRFFSRENLAFRNFVFSPKTSFRSSSLRGESPPNQFNASVPYGWYHCSCESFRPQVSVFEQESWRPERMDHS